MAHAKGAKGAKEEEVNTFSLPPQLALRPWRAWRDQPIAFGVIYTHFA